MTEREGSVTPPQPAAATAITTVARDRLTSPKLANRGTERKRDPHATKTETGGHHLPGVPPVS